MDGQTDGQTEAIQLFSEVDFIIHPESSLSFVYFSFSKPQRKT